MPDQGVAWLRLHCFKPSFLALTRRGVRTLDETYTEDIYRSYSPTTSVLSNDLSAHRRCVKETKWSLNHSELYKAKTKRG